MDNNLIKDEQGLIKTGVGTAVNPQFMSAQGLQQAQNFAISTKTLSGNTNPLIIPTPTPSTSSPTPITSPPQGTTTGASGYATYTPPTPTTPEKSGYQKILDKISGSIDIMGTKAEETRKAQEQQQLAIKTQNQVDTYNAYISKKRGYEQQIQEMRNNKGGLTKGQLDLEVNNFTTKANADLANLSFEAEMAKGQVVVANQIIKDKISAQFDPIMEQADLWTKFATLNANDLTESEKFKLTEISNQKKTDVANLLKLSETLHENVGAGAPDVSRATIFANFDKITQDFNAGKIDAQTAQSRMYQAAGKYSTKLDSSTTSGIGGVSDASVEYYTQLLAQGKITLANVPQNVRNMVVEASRGIINKPLSDVAITKINDTNFAITSLNDLRAKVQTNISQLGPITGLEALNPWSVKRQLQADIDRVRQTVGKALEGGVLRKEDEEKYKKILATITDTPETALYKIDALISSIQRNIEDYKSLQSESGRFVPTKSGTNAPTGTTSSGNSYTVTKE